MRRVTFSLPALFGLSLIFMTGCGGLGAGQAGGSAPPDVVPPTPDTSGADAADLALKVAYNGMNAARTDMFDRRKLLKSTPEQSMPSQGSASFAGVGSVAVETPGAEFTVLGNADLRADFATFTITGTVDDLVGRDAARVKQAYAGTLQVLGGIGAGAMKPDRFAMVAAGTLTSPDQTIRISNDLTGGFRGTDYSTLFATTGFGDTIMINGSPVVAAVQIIAEKQ